ncbi:hypothetical protein ONS95_007176 [Cadophora gregata]|uniref:uncharacterized protein n=1 Tax=Cadophora gregata TaxID=51156 RepID=UPI0026DDBA8E|nr:uncharacterized protein ONS95_007176 [Cadophora gregata]KAK0100725.1 hypothetical protein ONS95_007176 [Cadophora gregata]KAK0117278.1 hypothetical protein ONS96_013111 [Cadophora gregata f. sp. sojae]
MHIPIAFSILLFLTSRTVAYPASYIPADATETLDADPEPPTPTYYQPINTAVNSPSPPLYYPPASTPAQSYTNPVVYTTNPSYLLPSPTTTSTSWSSDCTDQTTTPPASSQTQTQTLTLTTPLVILPASPSLSPSPSPSSTPHQPCHKCCPPPPAKDDNGRKGDWVSGLGVLLAEELVEGVQDMVGRVEGRCGLLGGRGHEGNATMVMGCSVFAGGVYCAWSW